MVFGGDIGQEQIGQVCAIPLFRFDQPLHPGQDLSGLFLV